MLQHKDVSIPLLITLVGIVLPSLFDDIEILEIILPSGQEYKYSRLVAQALIGVLLFLLPYYIYQKYTEVKKIQLKSDGASINIGAFTTTIESYSTNDEAKAVIKAISDSSYSWDYLENIINDSGLSLEIARDKLNWLLINNLATEYDGVGGKVYELSLKGRSVFSRITNQT